MACDGGVFVSTASGQERLRGPHHGLPIVEAGFVACHPSSDAASCSARRTTPPDVSSAAIWRFEKGGDSSSVALDQVLTSRYIAPAPIPLGRWPNPPRPPVRRGVADFKKEDDTSSSSTPATSANGALNRHSGGDQPGLVQRVDWGAHWVTLPNGVNDRGRVG